MNLTPEANTQKQGITDVDLSKFDQTTKDYGGQYTVKDWIGLTEDEMIQWTLTHISADANLYESPEEFKRGLLSAANYRKNLAETYLAAPEKIEVSKDLLDQLLAAEPATPDQNYEEPKGDFPQYNLKTGEKLYHSLLGNYDTSTDSQFALSGSEVISIETVTNDLSHIRMVIDNF